METPATALEELERKFIASLAKVCVLISNEKILLPKLMVATHTRGLCLFQRGKEAADAGWRLKSPADASTAAASASSLGERRCVRKYTPFHLRSALQVPLTTGPPYRLPRIHPSGVVSDILHLRLLGAGPLLSLCGCSCSEHVREHARAFPPPSRPADHGVEAAARARRREVRPARA